MLACTTMHAPCVPYGLFPDTIIRRINQVRVILKRSRQVQTVVRKSPTSHFTDVVHAIAHHMSCEAVVRLGIFAAALVEPYHNSQRVP